MENVEGEDDVQYFADVERDHFEEESDGAEPDREPTDDHGGVEEEDENDIDNEDRGGFESDSSSIVDELLFADEDNEVLGGLQVPHTPDEGDLMVGSRRVSMVEGIEELPEEILLVVKKRDCLFARLY